MELNGSLLSGGYPGSAPLQHNFSISSVASTYSEFAVIDLFSYLPVSGSTQLGQWASSCGAQALSWDSVLEAENPFPALTVAWGGPVREGVRRKVTAAADM